MGKCKWIRAAGLALAMVGAASLTGCASIVDGKEQIVSVEATYGTDSVTGAACKLQNDKGSYFVTTPGTVTVRQSSMAMVVSCEKAGLANGNAKLDSKAKGLMYGNIILGGLIGVVIDYQTGAGFRYPMMLNVPMGEMPGMPAATVVAAPATAPQTYPVHQPTAAPEPAPAVVAAPAPVVMTAPAQAVVMAEAERLPFRPGVSSVTVENMAKVRGCTGGQGAGLTSPQGPVEMYRMMCSNGQVFAAKCEFRQCTAM